MGFVIQMNEVVKLYLLRWQLLLNQYGKCMRSAIDHLHLYTIYDRPT